MGKQPTKILILLDKKKVLEHGINLGDTALSIGLYDLIQRQGSFELISGGWKNFPYLNYTQLKRDHKKTGDIEIVLKKWFGKVNLLAQKGDSKFLKYLLTDSILIKNKFVKGWELRTLKKYNFSYPDKIRAWLLKSLAAADFFSKIKDADLIIFSGGGNLRDHNKPWVPGYLFEMYLAKMMGKKVIAANYTLYLNDPLLKKIANSVLSIVDYNFVREPVTQQILLDIGISGQKIGLMPDSAFGIDINSGNYDLSKVAIPGKYQGSVGVNLRGDKEINTEFWLGVIKYIREKYNLDLYFFYTCKACDKIVYKKLNAACGISEVSENLDYIKTIALMKKMKFVITDRYHAAVFSVMAGTPFLPVNAKTHKIEGLLRMIDYPVNELKKEFAENLDETRKKIDFIVDNHEYISNKLTEDYKNLHEQSNSLFKKLLSGFYESDI